LTRIVASLKKLIGRVKKNMPALFLTLAIFFMGLVVVGLQSSERGSFASYVSITIGCLGVIMLIWSYYLTNQEERQARAERRALMTILARLDARLEAEQRKGKQNGRNDSDNRTDKM
jgi:Na+/melibiose symporter-like transporter